MYYRLKKPWSFRGWKKLPYAIRAEYGEKKHDKPLFFEKDVFLTLLYCNGEEEMPRDLVDDKIQKVLEEMLASDVLEKSEEPLGPLESWQRYFVFPSRYVKGVHWSITGKCNFRCRHCIVSAPQAHHPQLPLKDCLTIVDEIAKCGITRVDITGGEPLVRNDLEEIVKALSRYGIDIGVFFTNASLLDANTLKMLETYHQRPNFQLSFDGLGYHDWLRGVEGAQEQADAAFRLLQEHGFTVSVAMCIHRVNKDSLKATVDYLAGYGVKSLRVNAPQNLGVWQQYSAEYALTEDEVWETYRKYIPQYFEDGMPIDIELDGYFRCKKGETKYKIGYVHHTPQGSDYAKIPYCESVRYHIYIGADGRIAPCMGFADTALKDRFPSVLEEHLGTLTLKGYYHDVVETSIADLMAKNPECAACEYLPACCGGCMVEGMTQEGNYLTPDPRCCYFHKHIGENAVRAVADDAIIKAGYQMMQS